MAWYDLGIAFNLHCVGLQLPTKIVRFYGLLSQLVGLDMLLSSDGQLLCGHIQLFRGAFVKRIRQFAALIAEFKTLLGLFKLVLRRLMIVLHLVTTLLEVADNYQPQHELN